MESQVRELARKYLRDTRETGASDLRATCPFCGHKRTFVISLDSGVWWCFACQDGGGLSKFLRQTGVDANRVAQIVAKLGLNAVSPAVRKRQKAAEAATKTVTELPDYLLRAWKACPLSLLEAGFDEDVIEYHEVGYDAVHDRITFPIRDHRGRLVAVSGRACDNRTDPRYKVYDAKPPDRQANRPAGELYGIVEDYVPSNREYLYGIHDVYPGRYHDPSERDEPLILVEGYKACLWLRQQGFIHTLALQGYSLTEAQRRILQRLRGPYYILLDWEPGKQYPDTFGRCAAVKIAERLSRAGRVFIPMYPGFSDENPHAEKPVGTSPDDLAEREIGQLLRDAQTLVELEIGASDTPRAWKRGA